ncbi:MAG: 23S rRNA (cytosine1962-C5)-methyltransferase/23S rRNA (guanine2445-N2)-methyltransferase [Bacteriovoracaceae bacterium]|jgi:23S rRNA (cytosine1962-C5)-methyltransferase
MKDSSIILNRLRKNLKNRKNLVKNSKLTAYRLYEKDIPEYPYIIDIYNEYAVVYEKGKRIDEDDEEILALQREHQKHIEEALDEVLNIPMLKVIFKKRQKQKGSSQYNKICKKDEYFPVNENGMKFLVNLFDYLDTGLFLDHRPLRKMIKDSSLKKKVLNLFSYTGSISVAAAMGGGKVTTIDMSKTYMDWAVENFWENQIDPEMHTFIQTDVIQYLEAPLKEKYDIIILDPPSFSNSKRMQDVFDIQEDHGWMIRNLMKSLTPTGVLYFSNNFRKFKLDEEILTSFEIKDITKKSIPMDFRDLKIHVCFELRNK